MKGTRLSYVRSERHKEIQAKIVELGGRRVREMGTDTTRRGSIRLQHTWFGERKFESHSCFSYTNYRYGQRDQEHGLRSAPKKHYDLIRHFTLTSCKPACYLKATVVCVRRYNKTGAYYMDVHAAGDCPYCLYERTGRYDLSDKD